MKPWQSYLKPSWRKVLSDLIGNRTRTLLVVASIAVGVFAVGMIAGSYYIIPSDMNASYSNANPANIQIQTRPFDENLIRAVERTRGVSSADGERTISVRMKTPDGDWVNLNLIARTQPFADRIDLVKPLSGAVEPGKNEIILEKRAVEKYHLGTGDVLELKLEDDTIRRMKIAGTAQDLTSGIGGMFNNTKGYISDESIEWLHEPYYFSRLLVRVVEGDNDPAAIQAVADNVKDTLAKDGYEIYQIQKNPTNVHPMESILQAIIQVLLYLGVLIVFLSGSLISNTLTALLNQHLPQIGVMKLVGAQRRQIIRLYLALILSFGLLSLVIAIPLGSWAAYALSDFAAGLINFPLNGFRIVPQAILIQIVIGLFVPLLAGIWPVVRGAGVTVDLAISGGSHMQEAPAQKSLMDQGLGRLRSLSRPLLISVRNTFRRKGRLVLTLLTLTLGGAIFISVFNVQVSLNQKIEQITKYFSADVNLDFNRPYPIHQITALVRGMDEVVSVEPWAIGQANVLNEKDEVVDSITLLGPPANSPLVTPIITEGRWIEADDKNALTVNEAFMRKVPGLKVGDTIHLKVGTREADWTVVGIFQFTGINDLIAYSHYDHLARTLNYTASAAAYRITTLDHSLEGQTRLAQEMDARFRARGYDINSVEAGGTITNSVTEYIGVLTAFLVVMALLTASVGSIGMAGTLSMNVMERTREIGVLRAIGAYDTMILRLVLVEGLLIGLISFVLGSILSFPITHLLANVISMAIFSAPAQTAFTLQGFIIWLGVVILLSIGASLIPARNASRMTIREVLAYE